MTVGQKAYSDWQLSLVTQLVIISNHSLNFLNFCIYLKDIILTVLSNGSAQFLDDEDEYFPVCLGTILWVCLPHYMVI